MAFAHEGIAMTDFSNSQAHPSVIAALIDYVWALLGHRHRAMQVDGVAPRPDDPWPGIVVSPLVAEARLAERAAGGLSAESVALLDRAAAGLAVTRAAFDDAAADYPRAPLLRIKTVFRLDDAAWLAVCIAFAAEVDPDLALTLAWLQGSYEKRFPTPGLVADVIGDARLRLRARVAFEQDAPLVALRLIEFDQARPFDALVHRPFRLDGRLVRFAMGDAALPLPLRHYLTLVDPDAVLDDLIVSPEEQGDWDRFRAFAARPREAFVRGPVVILRGQQGAGRRRWLVELCRTVEVPLLVCDLAVLIKHHRDLAVGIGTALREAALQQSALIFVNWSELFDLTTLAVNGNADLSPEILRHARYGEVVTIFDQGLERHRGLVSIALEPNDTLVPELARGLEIFEVPSPSPVARRRHWDRALTPAMRASGIDPKELALRFSLTPGRIREAVATAVESARRVDSPEVTVEDIATAVRSQVQTRMGAIATLRRSTEVWDDLVAAPEVAIQLRELCHRYRYRDKVMDGWGLRRRFSSAFGLSALFEGSPGTGKTMSAGLVAAELGLDLYQIDLSQMVTKWIGETEKNLSKVFDEAERSGAMLLFDEADSLFSKRTSVSSSNDRYANLEVNYLLQRIERFTGVAVLTTNFADSLDSAFARRLSMRITFPTPGIPERTRLWETMLDQPGLPLGEFDCEALAEDFEFAGGLVRNAVLRAAFFAASRNIEINQALLVLSSRIEMKEKGLLIRGNPHVELIELLTKEGSR